MNLFHITGFHELTNMRLTRTVAGFWVAKLTGEYAVHTGTCDFSEAFWFMAARIEANKETLALVSEFDNND